MAALTTWYDHLERIKLALESLRDEEPPRLPQCQIEVVEAPPTLKQIERISRKMLTQVFISPASVIDTNELANYNHGLMTTEIHVYSRDGHSKQQRAKYEKNRLAALICEQLHVLFRDPTRYQFGAPVDADGIELRNVEIARAAAFSAANLSFDGGDESADACGLAHWLVIVPLPMESEPMVPTELIDLTQIDVDVRGTEFGGVAPDPLDDEKIRVTFPLP